MSDKDDKKGNPWGDKKPQNEDGPPELGQFFSKLFSRRKKPKLVNNSGGDDGSFSISGKLIFLIIAVVVVIWGLAGIYVVQQPEQGVILRFGKYMETVGPGAHWMPRLIDTKYIVNTNRIMSTQEDALMLTSEENIVYTKFAVKYRITNPKAFLFNSMDPISGLDQIIDSAMREVVGQSTLNQILTTGRTKVRNDVETQIKLLVKRYKLGLTIVDVDMQEAGAPEQVKDAFDDVIKAREDQVTLTNQGKTYANKAIPLAKGQAARILEAAKADQQRSVLEAQGDVSRYLALLPQYKAAPVVTKERMYLTTMENVYKGSHLVMVDSKGNNNLFYWPGGAGGASAMPSSKSSIAASGGSSQQSSAAMHAASKNVASAADTASAMRQSYLRWQEAQSNAI